MNDYVVAISEDPYVYKEDSGINIQENLNLKKGTRFELIKEISQGVCIHEPRGMVRIGDKHYVITLEPKYGWVLKREKLSYLNYEYSNTDKHKYASAVNNFGVTQQMVEDYLTRYVREDGSLKSDIHRLNRHRDSDLVVFINKIVQDFVDEDMRQFEGSTHSKFYLDFYLMLSLYKPRRSQRFQGKITMYKDHQASLDEKETAFKAGRAFSIMFPYLDAAQIGIMVDSYRTMFAPREFELHTSMESKDFVWAYKHEHCKYQDPDTSMTRKSLAVSCMRGSGFDHLDHHPAEFYASGDFMIVWLTTHDGFIGARCVVRLPYIKYSTYKKDGVLQYPFDYDVVPHIAAPVYGTCDTSINMIEEYLDSIGADRSSHFGGWLGAKVLALTNGGNDRYFGAYIDIEPRMLSRVGKYLVIDDDGDLSAEDTGGTVGNYYEYYCQNCDQGLDDYDQHYSEATGETYCETCYYDIHTVCQHCDDSCHNEDIITAYRRSTRIRTINETPTREEYTLDMDVCTDCCVNEFIYCEEQDEHWQYDDVQHIEDEGIDVPIHLLGDSGFKETENGEYTREGE